MPRLVTSRTLVLALWANNGWGGAGGDAVANVRMLREEDVARSAERLERIAADIRADERGEDEVTADLLVAVGLPSDQP